MVRVIGGSPEARSGRSQGLAGTAGAALGKLAQARCDCNPHPNLNGAAISSESVAGGKLTVVVLDLNRYKRLGQRKYTCDEKNEREKETTAIERGKLVGEEF